MNTIGKNIRKYRQEKGMTQKELADEINKNLGTNFKHNTISSWDRVVLKASVKNF